MLDLGSLCKCSLSHEGLHITTLYLDGLKFDIPPVLTI